jgi:hypothetical protein
MQSCITCGMPFVGAHEKEIGLETVDGPVCVHDVSEGHIRPAKEIFAGGVAFFQHAVADGDRALAERLTRKNMRTLSYWQTHPRAELDGPAATDAEFGAAMAKL